MCSSDLWRSANTSINRLTSYIGRLIEVFADLHGVDLSPYRSWTLTSGAGRVGCEPDECYLVGDDQSRSLPDLVVEVIWTSGGLDKLAIYQHLGVREVWFWQGGVITAHVLRAGGYARTPISEVMPGLDVEVLASYLDRPTVSAAKRDYRAHLRARR